MTASPPGGARRGHDAGDDFYVGYLDETPRDLARFTRRVAVALVLLGAGLGTGLALVLERFDEGVFEFGIVEEHEGELLVDPHPRLATTGGPAGGYLLVAEGKHGIDAGVESSPPRRDAPGRTAAGPAIRLSGTLIENPEASMLEVHSIELAGAPATTPRTTGPQPAGDDPTGPDTTGPDPAGSNPEGGASPTHTVIGEIVDTKCYLGAMKPGRGKPHRGCASLCIRGGIPAALLVRTKDGQRNLVHLVDPAGRALGHELLEWIGEPVAVAGQLQRTDDRLVLAVQGLGPAGDATGDGS